jgi:hypothetical protein
MLNKARVFAATSTLLAGVLIAPTLSAQQRPYHDRPEAQQRQDWDWDGNYQRLKGINAGTFIPVRWIWRTGVSRPLDQNSSGIAADVPARSTARHADGPGAEPSATEQELSAE